MGESHSEFVRSDAVRLPPDARILQYCSNLARSALAEQPNGGAEASAAVVLITNDANLQNQALFEGIRSLTLESLQLLCDSQNLGAADGIRTLFRALPRPRASGGGLPATAPSIPVISLSAKPAVPSTQPPPSQPPPPPPASESGGGRPVVIPIPIDKLQPRGAPGNVQRGSRPIDFYHEAFKTFSVAALPVCELYLQAFFGPTWATDLNDPPRPWTGHSLVMLVNKKVGSIFSTFNKGLSKEDLLPVYDLVSRVRANEARGRVTFEDAKHAIDLLRGLLVKLTDTTALKLCEKETGESWNRGTALDPLLSGHKPGVAPSARRTRSECEGGIPPALRQLRTLKETIERVEADESPSAAATAGGDGGPGVSAGGGGGGAGVDPGANGSGQYDHFYGQDDFAM